MFKIARHFSEVDEALSLVDVSEIQKAVELIREIRALDGTVWIAGNGGSAATASHFANDLNKMARAKAIAISDLTSSFLAYGNDDGWAEMFSGPARLHIGENDAVIGISCSGNSTNIVTLMKMSQGRFRIGMTGPEPNLISLLKPDALIRGMANEITVIEDIHLIACHSIARALMGA